MAGPRDIPEINERELRELSALADGTLDPKRRDEVAARIAASPELSALYERERHVVEMVRDAGMRVHAPAGLRARIEAQRPKRSVAARRRLSYGGALAGALAVVALALVLVLPGGAPGAPSVSQAAGVALRGPALVPPAVDLRSPGRLRTNIEDIYFPNWGRYFGWRASGERTDTINGRSAVTVYYGWHGRRLAYTIVGAPVLTAPAARITVRNGVPLRTLTLHGRLVVTWRRDGHTCVLSGNGVGAAELQKLASWEGSAD